MTCQKKAQPDEIRITVHTRDNEFFNVPVFIPIEKLHVKNLDNWVLYELSEKSTTVQPYQLESGERPGLVFIMRGHTQERTVKEFMLSRGQQSWSKPMVKISMGEETFTMVSGDKNILSYQHAEKMPPEGVDPVFRRSAFLHPVWSPGQTILTNIQPDDHYHHYGIWNPWTKTKYRGEEIDFWNLGEKQGTVIFKELISRIEGPVFGEIRVLQDHIKTAGGSNGEPVLHETCVIRSWRIDDSDRFWLIDFTSILRCATDSPVELTAYRYGGGIGYRAAEYWTNENSVVLTSEGQSRDDADGKRARWCMVSAGNPENKDEPGILFMSHDLNREHPEPMRVWPSDANEGRGDMFFEFCPIRHNDWILEPGREYTLKYRMLVFDNPISPGEAEMYWKSFVNSPEVEIILP